LKRSKRSNSIFPTEPIALHVESEEWQVREVQAGIAELDAGQNISHDKVSKWLNTWGNETKDPR
jgi:predicted transcriptional regulator